ncbi:hypothetical protein IAR50_001545 [Cryptococcus sp. DSM 104548]
MSLPAPVGYLYWYTTSIILFILTLYNVLYKLFHLARSRGFINTASSHDSRMGRIWRTGRALMDKYLLLTGIPRPPLMFWRRRRSKWQVLPTTQVFWRVGYTAGFLVLAFYGTGWDRRTYAKQAAWLAVAQVPLIIALAGKNNLISFLTGVPYDKLNYIHRAAGNLCLLGVWIHAGGRWSLTHGWNKAAWSSTLAHWGFVGIFSITLLSLISIQPFRRYVYEFFLALHIALVALMLAAFIMHWKAMNVWIYPGVGLWAADRLLRLLRIIYFNHIYPTKASLPPEESTSPLSPKEHTSSTFKAHTTAQITLLTPSTLLLTITRPSPRLSWGAGQHFYLSVPGVSRWPWERHPFTAATVPGMADEGGGGSDRLAFLIRVRDGFTKRLLRYAEESLPGGGYGKTGIENQTTVDVRAAVEGPYGPRHEVGEYDGVLMFVGGSGVSFAVATLLQTIQDVKKGKSRLKHITIVWMVTSRLHLDWITPLLSPHLKDLPPSLNVTLNIHVTRAPIPLSSPGSSIAPPPALLKSTPSDPSEHLRAQTELEEYLHRRVHERSEKHRRKSRWSVFSWASWGVRGYRRDGAANTRRASRMEVARELERKKSPGPNSGSHTASTFPRSSHEIPHHPPPSNFAWSEHYTSDRIPNAHQYHSPADWESSHSPSATPMRKVSTAGGAMPSVMEGVELVLSDTAHGTVQDAGSVPQRWTRPVDDFAEEGDLATCPRTLPCAPSFSERQRHVSISDAPPLISPSPRRASLASINFDRPRPSILLPSLKLRDHRSASQAPGGLLLDPEILAPPMSRSSSADSTGSEMSASSGASLASFTRPDTPPSIPDLLPSLGMDQDATTEESSLEEVQGKKIEAETKRPSTPTLLLSQLSSAADASPEEVLQGLALIGSIPDPQKRRESLEQWMGGVEGDLRKKANVLLGLDGEGGVVRWKTGRGDLRGEIRGMMDTVSVPSRQSLGEKGEASSPQRDLEKDHPGHVGERAKIWVGVCGPRSLLDSSRLAVRDELSGKAVWGGGVRIDFHAESFGW